MPDALSAERELRRQPTIAGCEGRGETRPREVGRRGSPPCTRCTRCTRWAPAKSTSRLTHISAHLHVGILARAAHTGGARVLSMHKLTVGDGYAYLTKHVAAGDAGLSADDSLTTYYEQT